jgi:hypothetical protein
MAIFSALSAVIPDFCVGLRRKRLRELSHTTAWARAQRKRAEVCGA